MDEAQGTSVIAIVEGERDARTISDLLIRTTHGPHGYIVGMTTGGAESWDDKLADDLQGKPVILIPDNDPAGARYAEAVSASLAKRDIPYDVVSLAGTGAKDISEFVENGHTVGDVIALLPGWCRRPELPRLACDVEIVLRPSTQLIISPPNDQNQ